MFIISASALPSQLISDVDIRDWIYKEEMFNILQDFMIDFRSSPMHVSHDVVEEVHVPNSRRNIFPNPRLHNLLSRFGVMGNHT
jgi:hypothetical protein